MIWEETKKITKAITYERKYNLAILNKTYIKALYYWIQWKRWDSK